MQIPVFEIKDSYIVKHKLEYNTSSDFGVYNSNGFTPYKQRMMFIDYDIARKSQSVNAENFGSIILNQDLTNVDNISISYLGDIHKMYLDGIKEYENIWTKDTTVFNNNRPIKSQEFKLWSDLIGVNVISVDDTINVEVYKKIVETGTVDWEYTSTVIDEQWSISGLTSSNKQWIINGQNGPIGYESGTTTWTSNSIVPYLGYESKVISLTTDSVVLEKKIDDYLFNNFSSESDVFFKIIANNHCDNNYNSFYDKLQYYKYFDNFDYNLNYNSLTLNPIKNSKDIYFNYDKITFDINNGQEILNFQTDNIYNKYSLVNFLDQWELTTDIIYKGKTSVVSYTNVYSSYLTLNVDDISTFQVNNNVIIETVLGTIYNTYNNINITNINVVNGINIVSITKPYGFDINEKVLFIYVNDENVLVNSFVETTNHLSFNVDSIFNYRKYTYIKLQTNNGNYHNVIINEINGNTITVMKPFNYQSDDIVMYITNLKSISDVSNVLSKTFENYSHDEYNKLTIQVQRKIYNTYAEIINKEYYNQLLRLNISGLIFENEKNIMTLKIFDPSDYKDDRLLYEPTEIVRIGKDRKTSIPTIIKDFKLGLSADVIDENIYSIYFFNPNIEDIVLVIDSNFT